LNLKAHSNNLQPAYSQSGSLAPVGCFSGNSESFFLPTPEAGTSKEASQSKRSRNKDKKSAYEDLSRLSHRMKSGSTKRSAGSENSSGASNSSARACEHLSGIGRSQEEHRRLQYQVHQQLQRIYGNKLQEIEQVQQQNHQKQDLPSKPTGKAPSLPAKQAANNKLLAMEARIQPNRKLAHLSMINTLMNDTSLANQIHQGQQKQQQQHKQLHHHNQNYMHQGQQQHYLHHNQHHHHAQHLVQRPNQSEQTYDSLNSMVTQNTRQKDVNNNRLHQTINPEPNDFYDFHPLQLKKAPLNEPIMCPLLEEQRHHGVPNGDLVSRRMTINNQANLVRNNLLLEDQIGDGDEVEDEEVEDDDEPDGHLDDQELLILDNENIDQNNNSLAVLGMGQNREKQGSSSSGAEERKRQLESLHYATATAAVLLNATASAAAALARVGEANCSPQRPRIQCGPKPKIVPLSKNGRPTGGQQQIRQAEPEEMYSETYHDVNNNQTRRNTVNDHFQISFECARKQAPMVSAENRDQQPSFGNVRQNPTPHRPTLSLSQIQLIDSRHQQQMVLRKQLQQGGNVQYSQVSGQNQQRTNAGNQILSARMPPMVKLKQTHPGMHYQSQHQMRPPFEGVQHQQNFVVSRQVGCPNQIAVFRQHLRQLPAPPQSRPQAQRQVQQQPEGLVPAVHHQQQIVRQGHNGQNFAVTTNGLTAMAILHQDAKSTADLVGMKAIRQSQSLISVDGAKRNTISYSVLLPQSDQLHQKHVRTNQHVYNTNGPFISAMTGAPSDASGHSNIPLIHMEKCPRKVSSFEKICSLDLTVFWWCLITVGITIMGVFLIVSRYLI